MWLQSRPEELTINNENGSREKIDNLTFNLKSNSPKYNRYKVGHPADLEAANLYTDIYDELYNFKKI